MAINERVITGTTAAAADGGAASAEQGLILHLDANDVDSYDGDGSVWYDISEHDVTIPLSDNSDNLQFELNFSDPTSYSGTGTTFNDISGNDVTITSANVTASDFDIDNGGYFNVQQGSEKWTIPHSDDTHVTSTNGFTYEFWLYFDQTGNDTFQFYLKGSSDTAYDVHFDLHESNGYTFRTNGLTTFSHNADKKFSEWVHIAFSYSSKTNPTQKLYINGELKKTVNLTGTVPSTSSYDTRIGTTADNANDLYGRLGCVRLYNTELSASEVGQNYRHGRDYVYTDLIDDTDLELHLDPASYSGSGSTWTADTGSNATITNASYDQELGDFFDLDGDGDIIDTNSSHGYVNQTYEIWIKADTIQRQYIATNYGAGTIPQGAMYFEMTSSGTIEAGIRNSSGSTSSLTTSTALSANKWYHLCYTSDGSNLKFYIDGELDSTQSATVNTLASNSQNLIIGYDPRNIRLWFDGQVGQFRTYSSSLTQDQVRQNFNFTKNDYPNGYNGTITGATWDSGGYFDFSGVDGSSRNKVTTGLTNIHTNFTVSIWVKIDSRTGFEPIFASTDSLSNQAGILLFVWSNTQFGFTGSNGTSASRFDVIATNNGFNVWHHVCCTQDSSNIQKLYINGELEGTNSTTSQGCSSTTLGLTLGGYVNATSNTIDGKISEFKIYDKALTASEITALFDNDKADFGL